MKITVVKKPFSVKKSKILRQNSQKKGLKKLNLASVPSLPGIYKLYQKVSKDNIELVYIGQSKDIYSRIKHHNRKFRIDYFDYIRDSNQQRREIREKCLIAINKPRYNNKDRRKGIRKVELGEYEKTPTINVEQVVDEYDDVSERVLEIIKQMYNGEPILLSKVKDKVLDNKIVLSKPTFYKRFDQLKRNGQVIVTNPGKQRYRKIKPIEDEGQDQNPLTIE